ncbi:Gfo/Idh/MocA family oxidoreductase [Streptomyces sp. NPDC002143]
MKAKRGYLIVGAGHRADTYIEALTGPYRDVGRIVAFCDTNPKRADHYRSAYGLEDVPVGPPKAFEELVERHSPDTVVVTSPDDTHDHYICTALGMGVDVITEKPMTIDGNRLGRIATAAAASSAKLTVTFNYRYSPRNSTVKRLLLEGAIGTVTSVHFEWLLDTSHGADYFRRWHRQKEHSGGLAVHKASHHFDLVNWWLADTPNSVHALGGLKFYGADNATQRGHAPRPRLGRSLDLDDPFRLDLAADPRLRSLYLDAESVDGYHRDVDVFSDGISIEDTLGLTVGYKRGPVLTYSLNAYSPWEGYRVAVNGTAGRIELDVVERSWVRPNLGQSQDGSVIDPSALRDSDADADHEGVRRAGERILVQRHWEPAVEVPIPSASAAHGGGDELLMRDLFREPAEDALGRVADYRDGMRSTLVGIAANRSLEEERNVLISEFGLDVG